MCCWCFVVCWIVKDDPGQTKSKNWTDVSLQRKWWISSPQWLGGKVVGDFCQNMGEVKWKRFRMTNNKLNILPETNIAIENPPFWWYLQGNKGVSRGEVNVSFREGKTLQVREAWGWVPDALCVVYSSTEVFSPSNPLKTWQTWHKHMAAWHDIIQHWIPTLTSFRWFEWRFMQNCKWRGKTLQVREAWGWAEALDWSCLVHRQCPTLRWVRTSCQQLQLLFPFKRTAFGVQHWSLNQQTLWKQKHDTNMIWHLNLGRAEKMTSLKGSVAASSPEGAMAIKRLIVARPKARAGSAGWMLKLRCYLRLKLDAFASSITFGCPSGLLLWAGTRL